MFSSTSFLLLFSLLTALTSAQFQFFEQMFSGGNQQQHRQQQEQKNVASDSNWYRKTYDSGPFDPISSPNPLLPLLTMANPALAYKI